MIGIYIDRRIDKQVHRLIDTVISTETLKDKSQSRRGEGLRYKEKRMEQNKEIE